MSSSSCRAQREPLSLMPPQPRVPAWLPALASEMSPFTVDEPWGPRCGGGVGWEPYPAPFKVNLGLSFFPAPSDTVAIFPAGGAHTFLCFTSKEKFAVFMQLKAKGNQGYCVTHFTADFTFSVQCEMSGGRTVCSDPRSGHRAWSLPPKALGAAGSSAGEDR